MEEDSRLIKIDRAEDSRLPNVHKFFFCKNFCVNMIR
jgi:hypothetical protein